MAITGRVQDAVVSIANTTIHGSGGLNIPTVLLRKHADWRWLDAEFSANSYWYSSVSALYEDIF